MDKWTKSLTTNIRIFLVHIKSQMHEDELGATQRQYKHNENPPKKDIKKNLLYIVLKRKF